MGKRKQTIYKVLLETKPKQYREIATIEGFTPEQVRRKALRLPELKDLNGKIVLYAVPLNSMRPESFKTTPTLVPEGD